MKWRESVSLAICRITERKGENEFTRQELIDHELDRISREVETLGKTPHQTLSRILQNLRDDEEIEFLGNGEYRLISAIVSPSISENQSDKETKRIETIVSRIVRDSKTARDLKIKYGYRCQICGERLKLISGYYCEAHHVKPLGKPHHGPDIKENLIVVCPNHHTLLDFAAIPIDVNQLKDRKHEISNEFIRYHNEILMHNKSIEITSKLAF